MNPSELLQHNLNYFNESTPVKVVQTFIKNMYLSLLTRTLFIQFSLYIPNTDYGELFFNSLLSGGLFVIFIYLLIISTALLYSNFKSISNYDIKPYSYLITGCFSYIFTYLTYYYHTQFYILNIHFLFTLFLSIFIFTNQTSITYTYNNLIKISFTSQLLVFFILSLLYNDFQYLLFTYLTSSLAQLYIIYNTENMIKNESRMFKIKTDEYLSGSILLYLDLFTICPCIKRMFTEII